jgi:uncharacterized membrane-anchored protein
MVIFGGLLAGIAVLHVFRKAPETALFWAAFILTRPLGAVVGDFLDKPLTQGGLALSRYEGAAVLAAVIVLCVRFLPQRAAAKAH